MLEAANPDFVGYTAPAVPDGDAQIEDIDFGRFEVPGCTRCGGVLKPDVVFFGENVPRELVQEAARSLEAADAMLVLGSSLMVYWCIWAIGFASGPRKAASRSRQSTSARRVRGCFFNASR